MRVFVLGAGASLHAGYPSAAGMGRDLATWIGTLPQDHILKPVIKYVTDTYGNLDNFESILADLKTSTDPKVRRGDILGHLQEALRQRFDIIRSAPALLYDKLARLLNPGDTIITFNYDLGVERALRSAGLWRIRTGYGFEIEGDEAASPIEVLKLHGSMNWRSLLFGGRVRGGSITHGNSLGHRPTLFFRHDLEYLGYPSFVDPLCTGLETAAVLPTLILPALPKQFYFDTSFGHEMKEFWEELWNRAGRTLKAADEVAIIGYSLPIADEAARNLLLNSSNRYVPVSISCGDSSERIKKEFEDQGFTRLLNVAPLFEHYLQAEENRHQAVLSSKASRYSMR